MLNLQLLTSFQFEYRQGTEIDFLHYYLIKIIIGIFLKVQS